MTENAQQDAFAYLDRTYFGEQPREQVEIQRLPEFLAGRSLFLDVGASLGQYTYYANQVMQGGRIIAFEADPDRFAELAHRCHEWQRQGTNSITVVHAAVGDGREPTAFFITGTHISGGFFPVPERASYNQVEVPQVLLDDYFEPGTKTLCKIDVEGAELRVLKGAEHHLASRNTTFMVEVTGWGDRDRGYNAVTLLRFVARQRFGIHKIAPGLKTFNYLIAPAEGYRLWLSHLRAAPVLLMRIAYRRLTPQWLRDRVEARKLRARVTRTIS